METKLKYLFIMICCLSSCTSIKFLPEDLKGSYFQQENNNIQLILSDETFFHIDTYEQMDAPPYNCDTLTYGYWDIDSNCGFLKLRSPEELNTSYVYMDVEEKEGMEKDSIYFFIHNPIEEHYKKYNQKYRELFYSIILTSNNTNFDARLASKEFDINPIILSNLEKINIEEIEINIAPKHDIPLRNIGIREIYTLKYEVKNPNSNIFIIKLPQLSYEYINHKRLTDDYIKIVNKNRLIWDGQEYIKINK